MSQPPTGSLKCQNGLTKKFLLISRFLRNSICIAFATKLAVMDTKQKTK